MTNARTCSATYLVGLPPMWASSSNVSISLQCGHLPPTWASPSNVGVYMAFVIVGDVNVGGRQLSWLIWGNMGGRWRDTIQYMVLVQLWLGTSPWLGPLWAMTRGLTTMSIVGSTHISRWEGVCNVDRSNDVQTLLVHTHTMNNWPITWFLKCWRLGEVRKGQEDGGEDQVQVSMLVVGHCWLQNFQSYIIHLVYIKNQSKINAWK